MGKDIPRNEIQRNQNQSVEPHTPGHPHALTPCAPPYGADGEEHIWVPTAGSGLTEGSGIWDLLINTDKVGAIIFPPPVGPIGTTPDGREEPNVRRGNGVVIWAR
ncbi:unnamed protein product [Boreogadus saida]